MTDPVHSVLIIGGGFAGMAAAIEFAKRGVTVDLVELDPQWRAYGAGISLGGATLRVFRTLGILDEFLKLGFAADGADICTPAGDLLGCLPTPRIAGPDVPGCAGVMRPVLASLLARTTRAAGVKVRLGETFRAITQNADGVDVMFTDGTSGQYDLVVGADGVSSAVRSALFPNAAVPTYTGQGVWRAVLPRPVDLVRPAMWMGPKIKPGVNPVSQDEMYLFVLEDREKNARIEPSTFVPHLKSLLAPFPAPVLRWIRDILSEESQIIYRPLEGHLVRDSWSTGRVVLVGDAVHATTPHLASGACIGLEDGVVLAEEVAGATDVPAALARFFNRRWERCRMVVENSLQLGEIEKAGGDKEEHRRIMTESILALAEPI